MKQLLFTLLITGALQANKADISPKKEKVVLVHGILNPYTMRTFRRVMTVRNWEVEDWRYPSRDKTIEEHADDLVKSLQNVSKDGKPINFVAYSMGGLILKSALNHPDCPKEALQGRIVVISSPLKGSKTAQQVGRLALGKLVLGEHAGRQLHETPYGGFDELGAFPEDVPLLIISGIARKSPFFSIQSDGVVSVEESCPSSPHEHQFVRSHHKVICQNIYTIDKAIKFLESDHLITSCDLKNRDNKTLATLK
ncbi:MAG: hypothetical protein K0U10_06845 [Gammaproteobacteria bacterium]|nr:hypothetical protein [Chlamydiia bacterium]MCH9690352.1 hypothetical protein [Gammaproteobacteria bacterium]